METTYTYESSARRRGGSRTRRGGRSGGRSVALGPKETRRLVQLGVCALLFGVVFFGRGLFPQRMETLREEVLQVIQSDTDFRAAFASLGRSIADGEPVAETLGSLCQDVFTGGGRTTPVELIPAERTPVYQEERAFLAQAPDAAEVVAWRFGVEAVQAVPLPVPEAVPEAVPTPEGVLPAQPKPVYTGPAMPEGASMEQVDLELGQITSPVVAAMASAYGWREHPIQGGEKFHSGVDLAADYGSPIGAFADGVVDYIGESPAYGQYLQIKHENGITSFYAHCSKLCVQPGQQVKLGEKVAEVGDTGNVTGTHLHFELKQDGVFLNPSYYIEQLS